MQVIFEQVGKHVIAECQTTKICGTGLSNIEALGHLQDELAINEVDAKKPLYAVRRAVKDQLFGELTYLYDIGSDKRITKLMVALDVLEE